MNEELNSDNGALKTEDNENVAFNGKPKITLPKLPFSIKQGGLAILVIVLLVAGIYVYPKINKPKIVEKCPGEMLGANLAAAKAINYINQSILQGNGTAALKEVTEQNCLYKVKITVGNNDFDTYITGDGSLFFPDGRKVAEEVVVPQENKETIGGFSVTSDTVCKENEKPIFYFFGSNGCPHCQWEHPLVEKIVKKFEGYIAFHNNMDSQNDQDIFSKYSTGGIPTLVLGCKYFRVGSGESAGEQEESKVLTALICKLTGNQPEAVCKTVKDLIGQISD